MIFCEYIVFEIPPATSYSEQDHFYAITHLHSQYENKKSNSTLLIGRVIYRDGIQHRFCDIQIQY
jgi:hypothetical protein